MSVQEVDTIPSHPLQTLQKWADMDCGNTLILKMSVQELGWPQSIITYLKIRILCTPTLNKMGD